MQSIRTGVGVALGIGFVGLVLGVGRKLTALGDYQCGFDYRDYGFGTSSECANYQAGLGWYLVPSLIVVVLAIVAAVIWSRDAHPA